jgi:ribonuclease Z
VDIRKERKKMSITRRELLKNSAATVGGLALGGALSSCSTSSAQSPGDPTQMNSLLASLPPYHPGTEKLGRDEMRISFMGTTCIPMISQAAVSVFVELGNGDCFVFDMGTGSIVKYWAMGVNLDKMYKIFLTHLHADHMGDLPFIYGFGPSYGRFWPLYIWGPSESNFTYTDPNGNVRGPFPDGTKAYCDHLTEMMRWHNESQAFLFTSYNDYPPPPYDLSNKRDAYDLVAFELDWRKTGKDASGNPNNDNVAYNQNGVKITHFPAVHCRAGSLSYKLEWKTPLGEVLSMIYCGDSLPNNYMIDNAKSGVDVLIHEIVMTASNWIRKMGIDPDTHPNAVQQAQNVQDSSHTPHKAYGFILDQVQKQGKAPRLAVGTHFQATDDTIQLALEDIRKWYNGEVTIAADTVVLNVTPAGVTRRRAVVSNYAWPITSTQIPYKNPQPPKYWKNNPNTGRPDGDPTAQLDPGQLAEVIDKKLYNAR